MPTSSLTGQTIGLNPVTGRPYTGSLPGGPTQAGKGAFGAVPTVPSPIGTQAGAIAGNLGNLGQLGGLTNQLNTTIAQQAALPFQLNLPNYGAMTGQSSSNILSQLRGQVPQDVANQLQQMAAERGVSTGSIGSPNANAALLRSLGLTSLGLQQQGEQNLTAAIGRTPTGQQFNPQSFLVTPDQLQQAQYAANTLAAAPNPPAAANAAKRAGQEGLNTSIGGLTQPRGGVTIPGADFFGNVYNPGGEFGGTIVGNSLGTGTSVGGVMGWPGGAQSGQNQSYGGPAIGSQGWWDQTQNLFDIGNDVYPGASGMSNFYAGPQGGQSTDLEDLFFNGGSSGDFFTDEG